MASNKNNVPELSSKTGVALPEFVNALNWESG